MYIIPKPAPYNIILVYHCRVSSRVPSSLTHSYLVYSYISPILGIISRTHILVFVFSHKPSCCLALKHNINMPLFVHQLLLMECERGDYKQVYQRVTSPTGYNININHQDHLGRTPLLIACQRGHVPVVNVLLTYCAGHINTALATHGDCQPIHAAAYTGHDVIVALLIRHGASVDARNAEGRTPLILASDKGHSTVIRELINNGAESSLMGVNGRNALHIAFCHGQMEAVRLLVEANEQIDRYCTLVNKRTKDGATALYLSAASGFIAQVSYLLQHGADPGICEHHGNSPLHVTSQEGHYDCLQLLIDS